MTQIQIMSVLNLGKFRFSTFFDLSVTYNPAAGSDGMLLFTKHVKSTTLHRKKTTNLDLFDIFTSCNYIYDIAYFESPQVSISHKQERC